MEVTALCSEYITLAHTVVRISTQWGVSHSNPEVTLASICLSLILLPHHLSLFSSKQNSFDCDPNSVLLQQVTSGTTGMTQSSPRSYKSFRSRELGSACPLSTPFQPKHPSTFVPNLTVTRTRFSFCNGAAAFGMRVLLLKNISYFSYKSTTYLQKPKHFLRILGSVNSVTPANSMRFSPGRLDANSKAPGIARKMMDSKTQMKNKT